MELESSTNRGEAKFVKPRASKANLRKKSNVKEEEEEDDEAGDVRKVIEETKICQKFRARGSGVDVEKLASAGLREMTGVQAESGSTSLLNSQFSVEKDAQPQYGLMEQHMMQYIDEKLSKKEPGGKEDYKPLTAEDELYMVPDNLKLTTPQEENGAETWLTGIVEVELPLDEKLRNIEETELAKRKILEERRRGLSGSGFIVDTTTDKGYRRIDQKCKSRGRRTPAEAAAPPVSLLDQASRKKLAILPTPGNFNANFMQHRPTRELKESAAGGLPAGRGGGASGGAGGGPARRPELSSDDLVMERFKKRFAHRK